MANVDSAFGLRPVGSIIGGSYVPHVGTYIAPSSYDTNIFIGDPVVVTGTSSAGISGGSYQQINVATAGATNQITGVVVGFIIDNNIVTNGYGIASTTRHVLVCDDPAAIFEIQEDSTGGDVALASAGLNANLASGTGSTYTKRSGWELDSSSVGADATYQLTIRNAIDRIDNAAASTNAKYLVTINLHTNRLGAVAGV